MLACINQKCVDPCIGACGVNTRCEVINNSPICSCKAGETGDPFQGCYPIPRPPQEDVNPCEENPCQDRCNPCGPNSQCRSFGPTPSCTCISGYIGQPPNCRPECVISADCPAQLACINNRCQNPCEGSCGIGAECHVISHTVSCVCPAGFTGNPFNECIIQQQEEINPCEPSPCASNALCEHRNGIGACRCIDGYHGNPYEGCRPECVLSSDCRSDKACVNYKCVDPCPGVCGSNAECNPVNHVPTCTCRQGLTGDPFIACHEHKEVATTPIPIDVCRPSPCGPHSRCHEANGIAVCSCVDEYIGTPPNCRPMCTVNSECPQNKACHKFKCTNPCVGACGADALCQVINHNPICSCPPNFEGDPLVRCQPKPNDTPAPAPRPTNPCIPSPCGNYAECRPINDRPICSCLPNYYGSAPNCKPECLVNTDCPLDKSCIAERCLNPCEGSCGFNSECRIQNHIPICTCRNGFTGDPFTQCVEIIEPPQPKPVSPCDPNPCGSNAICDYGTCTCINQYHGDPYVGCRPECTTNNDCSPNKACINNKCIDPCPGTCGTNAICHVSNHIPSCSCPERYQGDPFVACRPVVQDSFDEPCNPNPCK